MKILDKFFLIERVFKEIEKSFKEDGVQYNSFDISSQYKKINLMKKNFKAELTVDKQSKTIVVIMLKGIGPRRTILGEAFNKEYSKKAIKILEKKEIAMLIDEIKDWVRDGVLASLFEKPENIWLEFLKEDVESKGLERETGDIIIEVKKRLKVVSDNALELKLTDNYWGWDEKKNGEIELSLRKTSGVEKMVFKKKTNLYSNLF